MGYLHIENLFKNEDILLFKECYTMEKIHGTSAHVGFKDGKLHLFSGGEKMGNFEKAFDKEKLEEKFKEKGLSDIVVFGEAYGGKQQGMSPTYGKETRFVCFDVKIGNLWLDVPHAEGLVNGLGLEFVYYKKIPCELEAIDAERDADSTQAIRNGMGNGHIREGVVLRPLSEFRRNDGERIIAKHKRPEFRETVTLRKVGDIKQEFLQNADAIALEWVTHQRLLHVLDKVFCSDKPCIQRTGDVVKGMIEDVAREAHGEIVDPLADFTESKVVKNMIGRRTAHLFKDYLRDNGFGLIK